MPSNPSGARSEVAKIVEKQMRNWELSRAQRVPPQPYAPPCDVCDFVCISRAVGSGGSQVATLLGEQLGWPMFDREILQVMARDDKVRTRLFEHLDERDVGWLEDAVRWLIRGASRPEDYFHRLTETILALARQGRAVFLGRGADLILPRDRGLRVRIIASIGRRAESLAARKNTTATEALSESRSPRMGMERVRSQWRATKGESPLPSAPITTARFPSQGSFASQRSSPSMASATRVKASSPQASRTMLWFETRAISRCSQAPAEALATAGVTWTAWCFLRVTPVTPAQ